MISLQKVNDACLIEEDRFEKLFKEFKEDTDKNFNKINDKNTESSNKIDNLKNELNDFKKCITYSSIIDRFMKKIRKKYKNKDLELKNSKNEILSEGFTEQQYNYFVKIKDERNNMCHYSYKIEHSDETIKILKRYLYNGYI